MALFLFISFSTAVWQAQALQRQRVPLSSGQTLQWYFPQPTGPHTGQSGSTATLEQWRQTEYSAGNNGGGASFYPPRIDYDMLNEGPKPHLETNICLEIIIFLSLI